MSEVVALVALLPGIGPPPGKRLGRVSFRKMLILTQLVVIALLVVTVPSAPSFLSYVS